MHQKMPEMSLELQIWSSNVFFNICFDGTNRIFFRGFCNILSGSYVFVRFMRRCKQAECLPSCAPSSQ